MNSYNHATRAGMSRPLMGLFAILAATATAISAPSALAAQTIIDEWGSVKAPPAPELKAVTVDTKSTALLLLDFAKQNCGKRPRCLASLPKVQKMAGDARAANILVVHAMFGKVTKGDLLIAPLDDESMVRSGADKFFRTDLEKILKDKGITTVIVTGTAAHGAVLYTASTAAMLGFNVVVPIDAVSSLESYTEQYTVWHLVNAPGGIGPKVTLTRIDMLKF